MIYYEIYNQNGIYEIWKMLDNGISYKYSRVKVYKTRAGAEKWASKQWYQVIWR